MKVKPKKSNMPFPSSARGSALGMTLIFVTALALIVGVTLRFSSTEFKINNSEILRTQALYTSESVLEMGFAEIQGRLNQVSNFPATIFHGDGALSAIDTDDVSVSTEFENYEVIEAEVTAGLVPPGSRVYFDPMDETYASDPLKGQWVTTRNALVLSKATLKDPAVGELSSFGRQRLQIRDSPLFAYAIFFDDEMFLAPGAPTTIDGPVHGNSNIVLHPFEQLKFLSNFSTAGDYLYATERYGKTFNKEADFYFSSPPNKSGDPPSLSEAKFKINGTEKFWDSSDRSTVDIKTEFFNRFGTFVQTKDNDIQPYHPAAFEELRKDGHDLNLIIQPPVQRSSVDDDEWDQVREFERQKFANKAGIVFEVDVELINKQMGTVEYDLQRDSMGVEFTTETETNPWELDDDNVNNIHPSDALTQYLQNLLADDNRITINAYKYTADPNGQFQRENGMYSRTSITDAINTSGFPLADSSNPNSLFRTEGPLDRPIVYDYRSNRDWKDRRYEYADTSTPVDLDDVQRYDPNVGPSLDPTDPNQYYNPNAPIKMFDSRRRQWIHQTELDVGNLKRLLDDTAVLDSDWNGVVYVEFTRDGRPLSEFDELDADGDLVNPSRTGLRLINAEEVPSTSGEDHDGFTIATNNAIYVKGNFNADGDLTTGTGILPDDITDESDIATSSEPAAAIVADTIYALSNNWNDTMSRADIRRARDDGGNGKDLKVYNEQNHRMPADNIEISAALLSGLGGTDEEDFAWRYRDENMREASNGGPMNYVQMLEFMQDPRTTKKNTLRLRTSMVQLFESKVVKQPHAKRYQLRPPARDYGFHAAFATGDYPPGTPTVRSFKRVRFREISENEYEETQTLIDQANANSWGREKYEMLLQEIQEKYESQS